MCMVCTMQSNLVQYTTPTTACGNVEFNYG